MANIFNIQSTQLVELVMTNQSRTFAEDIKSLQNMQPNPTDWLLQELRTDPKNGINANRQDISLRIESFGSNIKEVVQPPGFLELFWESLDDLTLKILIGASFVMIAIEVGVASPENRKIAWIQGFAIFVAVLVSSLVTTINNYQKQRQFYTLTEVAESRKKFTVRRNSTQLQLHQNDLVVGDLVILSQGMEIPCDGYLIEANQLLLDESAMTGQSQAIQKQIFQKCLHKMQQLKNLKSQENIGRFQIPSPIILSGTKILTGSGLMIVLVVGGFSCLGKLRALATQKTKSETPLQEKLEKVAMNISKFGLGAAITIVSILLIRFGITKIITRNWETSIDLFSILNFFVLGITVIVVAIPQGLPLSVSLVLALSVKKMLKDKNLVRRLEACQTMGGANMICSDKTGTLTTNKMTLVQYYHYQSITKKFQFSQQSLIKEKYFQNSFFQLFRLSACINSSADLRPTQKGSSTQIGILKLVQKFGINYLIQRQKTQVLMKIPFNSKRKRMSVVIKNTQLIQSPLLLLKGAAQLILQSCSSRFLPNGIEVLSHQQKLKIKSAINKMASNTLRTISLAYKILPKNFNSENIGKKNQNGIYNIQNQDMIFLCLLGLRDVPRPEVKDAIQECRKAGIRVRMVTGDNLRTAQAIAKQIGIIRQNQSKNNLSQQNLSIKRVMEGFQFINAIGGIVCKKCKISICQCQRDAKKAKQNQKDLRIDTVNDMDTFKKITQNLDVLARSRPQDKYALVLGLKQLGNVVAVTGDGTNDAPALKKSDVGFAMGISGTQIARQASSIILLDDNFSSIVKAVLWGRNIYDSIRKFIQFQLTVNVVAVIITLIGAVILQWEIIRPIQMLWINLIMDALASLALASQKPTHELLLRKPHPRNQSIISKNMIRNILIQAFLQLTILIILVFAGQHIIPQYPDQFDMMSNFRPQMKYLNNKTQNGNVRSGRMFSPSGTPDYMPIFIQTTIYSRHFTFIYNTFVMLQLFNFMNSRKLDPTQYNVFSGICENLIFILVVFVIFVAQVLLITFGGLAFGIYRYGLTYQQWLISIFIGSWGMFISLISKLIINFFCASCCFNQNQKIGGAMDTTSSIDLQQRVSPILGELPQNRYSNEQVATIRK